MPIAQSARRRHALRSSATAPVKEAKAARKQTAFLSRIAICARAWRGGARVPQKAGWEVYIDWEDSAMPGSPNHDTAKRIQTKVRDLNWFPFLATHHSMQSRLCPGKLAMQTA